MTEPELTAPRSWRLVFITVLSLILAMLPAVAAAAPTPPPTATVDPRLAGMVAARHAGPVEALLVLADEPATHRTRGDREQVVGELKRVARSAQDKVIAELHRRPRLDHTTVLNGFWLKNMLLVEFDGGQATLDALARLPGVDRVIANFELTLVGEAKAGPSSTSSATVEDRTWGLDRIEATRVQDELGIDGTGVRVATLDTGVDITHPDLAGKLATADPADPAHPGGWIEFDRNGNAVPSLPHDSALHGTHVSGTIHGGSASGVRIGVAPGATMMHGLVIPGGSGTMAQVTAGMQWALAPFDNQGNPAGEPADVINMSLGPQFGGYLSELVAPSRNAYRAGTVLVASSGNCGDGCHGSPGNVYENIAVGNTTITDDVNPGSSGGVAEKSAFTDPPADWPDTWVVPDVSAPGTDILSSIPGGYETLDGTSMASPHVAGTVALMRQAAPELTPAETLDILERTSLFHERHGAERPNSRLGHGRINAYQAVLPLTYDSGITGTVTDAATGDPLADVRVVNHTTGTEVTTGEDGSYLLYAKPGGHQVGAELFGYRTDPAQVEVRANEYTTHDIALDRAPTGAVSGTVDYVASGHGVPRVSITLDGTPLHTVSGAGGAFRLPDVPVGGYTVTARMPGFPNPEPVEVTVSAGATTPVEITLPAPLPTVGVLGDAGYGDGTISAFLEARGVPVEEVDWDDDLGQFDTIVVNHGGLPGEQRFRDFLSATDAAGTGVLFLDTWYNIGNGIYLLNRYLGNPEVRKASLDPTIPQLTYQVTAEHPVLEGFAVGDTIVLDSTSPYKDYAWFDGYTGDGRAAIADAARSDSGVLGRGIGVQQRANNRHVLLSMHGVSSSTPTTMWGTDAAAVFGNAVRWAARPQDPDQARVVPWNLTVESATGDGTTLSGRPVTISATFTNVGAGEGTHTARLSVDGTVEASRTVRLAGGDSTTVRWSVSRQELRTYQIAVGPLAGSFRVRPPVVDLSVSTVDDSGPLAGATVELLGEDGRLSLVGTTGDDGTVSFETTAPDGEYTVVVRRAATGDQPAYLLTRRVRVAEDLSLDLRPRTDASPDPGHDLVATVTLDADGDHPSWTYLRGEHTGTWAFRYSPGTVVATAGAYELRHLHAISKPQRDTWGLSAVLRADLGSPGEHHRSYGGPATATLDATMTRSGRLTGSWAVTDAHGNPFTLLARSDLRPFDAPSSVSLEDLPAVVGGSAPHATEVVLRVYDHRHRQVHGSGQPWPGGNFSVDLGRVHHRARYRVELTAGTGAYAPGEVVASLAIRAR